MTGLRLLVAVKRVVDPNIRVRARPDGTGIDTAGLKMVMNPFDQIALEEAVRLRESGVASDLLAVSVGSADTQETLRTALALGADRALLVETADTVEPLGVAKLLQLIVESEGIDLALLGKQAIDDDACQTGQMLAGLLGWGQGTFVSRLTVADGSATVEREVDGGIEVLRLRLPAVVTADLRLNEPRYTSLTNIMKAKRKPLEVRLADRFGLDLRPRLEVIETREPSRRRAGVRVATVAELLDRLDRAGVI